MGFVINRLNVAMTGMAASSGVSYFPSWMEFAVTIGIISLGFALFSLAVNYLPVFPKKYIPVSQRKKILEAHHRNITEKALVRAYPPFHGGLLLILWGLLFIGVVTVGFSLKHNGQAPPVSASNASVQTTSNASMKLPPDYTFPRRGESPGPVTFSHESHIDSKQPSCAPCHATRFKLIEPGKPVRAELTSQQMHSVELCGACHDGKNVFGIEDDCSNCHR